MAERIDESMKEEEEPVGWGKCQIRPLQALLFEIEQNLEDPEMEELRTLVRHHIPKDDYGGSSARELFQILLDKRGEEDTVKLLKNVFTITNRHLTSSGEDYGKHISSMFERYEREVETYRKKIGIRRCSHFVGRDEYIESILGVLCSTDIKAVSICGMGGVGKTTLATEVCYSLKKSHYFEVYRIDLRGISDVSLLLINILDKLDSESQGVDASHLKDFTMGILNRLPSETVLFLDNLDGLLANEHFENFLNELRDILSRLTNKKVKLLLTMRNKLINSDHFEQRRLQKVTRHFCGLLQEFELEKLSVHESVIVLQKYTSVCSDTVSKRDLEKWAERCHGVPLLLTLIGSPLRNGSIPQMSHGQKVCSNISMWNIPEVEEILESTLNINKRYQTILLKLSVFLSSFSLDAAMSVLNCKEEETRSYLVYLQGRHIVNVDDSEAIRENESTYSNKNIIYSIHPLIIEYIICGIEIDDKRKCCVEVAERNLKKYFNDYLDKMADQAETKCLKVTSIINRQITHIWHTLQDVESLDLPDLSIKKNFLTALRRTKLLQTIFRHDEERVEYFTHISNKARTSQNHLWFIFMELAIIDQYMTMDPHKGHLKAKDSLQDVHFKQHIERLQSMDSITDGCRLLEGHYNYVQGRFYRADAKLELAYIAAKYARKIFKNHAREDLQLAKIYNLIGVISLDQGNIDKGLEYNTKAYELVCKTVDNHLHYDMVEYALCIGTCHYFKGDEIYEKTKGVKNEEYDKALEWFCKTLNILSKLNLRCTSRTYHVLNNLVSLCLDTKEIEKGMVHAMEAKTIAMQYMSSSPIDQVRASINLGHLFKKFAQGQRRAQLVGARDHYEKAEEEFNDVLVICRQKKLTAEDIGMGKGADNVYYENFSKGIIECLKCLKKPERHQKVMAWLESLQRGIPLSTGESDGSSSSTSDSSSDSENLQYGTGRTETMIDSSDSSEAANAGDDEVQDASPVKRQSSTTTVELETECKKLCLRPLDETSLGTK